MAITDEFINKYSITLSGLPVNLHLQGTVGPRAQMLPWSGHTVALHQNRQQKQQASLQFGVESSSWNFMNPDDSQAVDEVYILIIF